jgi:hypothetical protein
LIHDFDAKLTFSLGEREKFDLGTLKRAITGCIDVVKTNTEIDKAGVDYIATLRRGAQVLIDAKAREKGASRYWKNGEPELALEKWSVCPNGKYQGKTGWTLSESSNVDLILYTFDPEDSRDFYLIPFQQLRMAFIQNIMLWQKQYKVKRQNSRSWQSEAVFVPASVVIKAVTEQMKGRAA